MSSTTRTLAIALSAVLVLSVLGSGLAFAGTASVMTNHEDPDDGETIDECGTDDGEMDDVNGTDDGNESVDENGSDDGNETDGECGSEDDNATDDQPFGQVVTAYVHGLIDGSDDGNDTNATAAADVPLGQQIAAFVVANNPGKAPDHAGPKGDTGQPEHAGANETGKPAHAGGNETGQPDHAGPDGEKKGGPDKDNGGGPPGADDSSDEDEETDDE